MMSERNYRIIPEIAPPMSFFQAEGLDRDAARQFKPHPQLALTAPGHFPVSEDLFSKSAWS
jgi:hypothetical protein